MNLQKHFHRRFFIFSHTSCSNEMNYKSNCRKTFYKVLLKWVINYHAIRFPVSQLRKEFCDTERVEKYGHKPEGFVLRRCKGTLNLHRRCTPILDGLKDISIKHQERIWAVGLDTLEYYILSFKLVFEKPRVDIRRQH